MATATKTIAINAAFLQEIKQDNQDLRSLLQSAVTLLSARPFHVRLRRLTELLAALRDQFALHFTLEEAYGYFEDAVASAPRLSRQAEALREEHRHLFLELCQLEEQAERLQYHETTAPATRELTQIAHRFEQFHERFLDHEDRENELILEAFAQDLGDGD